MADPTWGMLPKSQVDPQLIEERIAQMISEHESDPEAHLGVGESLEQHKTNEIIDHPAQSIVADKFSSSASFVFIPVLPYQVGRIDNCDGSEATPYLIIEQQSPFSGDGTYQFSDFNPYDSGYADGESVVDFILMSGGSSGSWEGLFTFGWGRIETKEGFYRIGYFSGTWQYTSWTAINLDYGKRFRFHYDANAGTIQVFVSGVEVLNTSYSIDIEDDETSIYSQINRGSSSTANIGIANLNVYFEGL
ncbi:MAG: hypothetical protein V4538_17690 [Bacteroidota bacterium]